MLFDLWRQTVRTHASEIAVRDLATGECWTFHGLDAAAEREAAPGPIIFPEGQTAQFILAVLRGWRRGGPICPIEPGQLPGQLPPPPPWCAHLKMTSATTGPARAVAFRAEQIAADLEQIAAAMQLRPDWPNIGAISLAHSYGFSSLVLPLLLQGIPLVLVDAPLPNRIRQAAALAPEVALPAVPALWRAWFEAGAIPANIGLAISAGAPLPPRLEIEVFQKYGLKIHNFYGASECGGIAYDSSLGPRQRGDCAGQPLPGVRLSVTESGCLEVNSPAVGETYWPQPTAELAQGTFRSSDLAEYKAGSLFLKGRGSDVIHSAGRKISPEIIEAALLEHPEVRSCVVFGVPNPETERGEVVVAYVALRQNKPVAALRAFLQTRLAAWQIPREWRVIDSLEANRRGKVSRAKWRERHLQGQLGPSRSRW